MERKETGSAWPFFFVIRLPLAPMDGPNKWVLLKTVETADLLGTHDGQEQGSIVVADVAIYRPRVPI